MNAGWPSRDAVVRHLARHAVTWSVLHAYHHGGLDAAAVAVGFRGAVGRDDDDVFRAWQSEAAGRRFDYREGGMDASPVRVPLCEVLDHVQRRFTAAQRRRFDELVAARDAAVAACPPRYWRCAPAERSREEEAAMAAAQRARTAAERALDQLLHDVLGEENRAGEQLDLFADAGGM